MATDRMLQQRFYEYAMVRYDIDDRASLIQTFNRRMTAFASSSGKTDLELSKKLKQHYEAPKLSVELKATLDLLSQGELVTTEWKLLAEGLPKEKNSNNDNDINEEQKAINSLGIGSKNKLELLIMFLSDFEYNKLKNKLFQPLLINIFQLKNVLNEKFKEDDRVFVKNAKLLLEDLVKINNSAKIYDPKAIEQLKVLAAELEKDKEHFVEEAILVNIILQQLESLNSLENFAKDLDLYRKEAFKNQSIKDDFDDEINEYIIVSKLSDILLKLSALAKDITSLSNESYEKFLAIQHYLSDRQISDIFKIEFNKISPNLQLAFLTSTLAIQQVKLNPVYIYFQRFSEIKNLLVINTDASEAKKAVDKVVLIPHYQFIGKAEQKTNGQNPLVQTQDNIIMRHYAEFIKTPLGKYIEALRRPGAINIWVAKQLKKQVAPFDLKKLAMINETEFQDKSQLEVLLMFSPESDYQIFKAVLKNCLQAPVNEESKSPLSPGTV